MSPGIAPHLEKPSLRPVEAVPLGSGRYAGRVGLRDRTSVAEGVVVVSAAALDLLARFDGTRTLIELSAHTGVPIDVLLEFVRRLDEAGLLEGPAALARLAEMRARFDALDALPIRAADDFTPAALQRVLNSARSSSRGQDVCALVDSSGPLSGIVVPHLDLERGQENYGLGWLAVERAAAVGQRWDRVIVLGTNHFGSSTGVAMCPKPWSTTHGQVPLDAALAQAMTDRIGPTLTEGRLDHLREHSLELQMPFIMHLLGPVPALGFLVHDPTVKAGASYDGRGVALDSFTAALNDALCSVGGTSLLIASADLSHVGTEFGDTESNTPESLAGVERHDRGHLAMLERNLIDPFLDSMTRLSNPTKWCTLGGMTAYWRRLPEATCKLLGYRQSKDELGSCCVTSAAMASFANCRQVCP